MTELMQQAHARVNDRARVYHAGDRIEIFVDDRGPADEEHVMLAVAVMDEGLTIDRANAIGLRLKRTASFAWVPPKS